MSHSIFINRKDDFYKSVDFSQLISRFNATANKSQMDNF